MRVNELPEPLREEAVRGGISRDATVELTLADVSDRPSRKTLGELMAEIDAELARQPRSMETIEDAADRIRKLRDEWD